jgi:hypothetical protein
LQRKNDTQQKEGGEEMLPHYTPKPHLKWKKQEFKRIYIMFKFEPKQKVVYLSSINLSTCPLTPISLLSPSLPLMVMALHSLIGLLIMVPSTHHHKFLHIMLFLMMFGVVEPNQEITQNLL